MTNEATASSASPSSIMSCASPISRLLRKAAVTVFATAFATSTAWAACTGVALNVGYDFGFGAKTGIAAFDAGTCVPNGTSVTPGDDYCSNDYVIRTNDTGVTTLKYTFDVGTIQNNYTVVVTIPAAGEPGATSGRAAGSVLATWSDIPSACSGPGTAISNGGRTLTCNLGTIDATDGAKTVAVPASFKVSNRALNGESFALQSSESSSGGSAGVCAPQPVAAAPALLVSARPKIDVKTAIENYYPTTYGGVPGYFMRYFVYVDGLNNATVGGEAVTSPLNFNVGLNSNLATPNAKFVDVLPYDGSTTVFSSTYPQGSPAGNGVIIPVKLEPKPSAPNCVAEFLVPGGGCQENPSGAPQRLATHLIRYFVPLTDFPNTGGQLDFTNFINSDGSAAAGPISTPPASGVGSFSEPVSENSAPYTAIKTLPGAYNKYTNEFVYRNGLTRPTGSDQNSDQVFANDTTQNWCVSGSCKQYPNKSMQSMIHVTNRSSTVWTNTIVCDKFDNRGMVLTRYPRKPAPNHLFPNNMPGDSIVGMYEGILSGTMPSGYTVEVASTGTPGYPSNAQKCGDGDAAWVDANSVTNYASYNLVRIKVPLLETPFTAGSDGFISPVFNFTVPAAAPNGAYIGNQLMIRTDTEKLGGANPGDWNTDVYDPITNSGVYTGERFQVVKALVRTQKEAFDKFGNTTATLGAGKTVTFRLSPSYSAGPGVPAPNANITVVDVLPAPLTYVLGSARTGSLGSTTALAPNSITTDGAGNQVLTWSLPNVVLNSAIPPIFIDVEAPATLPAGVVLTNKVTVSDPLVDQSTDAERTAQKAVAIDNVAGFFVTKRLSTPIIPRNGTFTYTLEVANLKSSDESNIDLIDFLPSSGDTRVPPSNFAGSRFLTGPVTGASAEVRYSSAAVGVAPTAFNSTINGTNANLVAGDFAIAPTTANGWCLASEFGSAGCPSSFPAVTGIRALIPTVAGNASALLTLPMGTSGNIEDNSYTNRFAIKGANFNPLFSNNVVTVVKQARLSGKVYFDSNGNSQIDAGEAPIAGVLVTLCNVVTNPCPSTNVVGTKTTTPLGTYEFTDLFPGTYFVQETQPAAYNNSGVNVAGSAGGTPSGPNEFQAITLGVGQNATNYNFGELGSSLSGKVCEDLNNDGVCQAGEPPIEGVVITLTGTDASGNLVTKTATTTATGEWLIKDIPNSNATGYNLVETQPAAYLDGKQTPGSLAVVSGGPDAGAAPGTTAPTTVGNDTITGIKFTKPTIGTAYDFTEVKPSSIQGFVYLDVNTNGVRDAGDIGLPGVTMELTGTNDMGASVTLTTTATISPDGSYTFANLRPGTYTVREIQPTGVADATVTVGSIAYTTTQTSAPGSIITETPSAVSGAGEGVSGIVLGSGGLGTNYNFGELPQVPVSGTVFLDKNFDGTITAGETGLPNSATTALTLCRTNSSPCPLADTVATTVTTPGSGTYTFPAVTPGSYFVVETQPSGFASSSPNTQPVTVAASPVADVNFAETGASLSGTVYADNNGGGTLDAGDVGIPNVGVKLCTTPTCAAGSVVGSTTTSPAGTYTFAGVPAPQTGDKYYIVEDQATVPASFVNGTTTVGTLVAGGSGGTTVPGTANTPSSRQLGIEFTMPTTVVTGAPPVVGADYNFGELPQVPVSGVVFLDKDFDGTVTPGETGLPNNATTTLTLCKTNTSPCPPADTVATTVTTPGSGTYTFPAVTPGSYFVVETQPTGYASSSPNAQPVTVATTPVTGVNFAETGATISGTVYSDNNATGTLDPSDAGIPNVGVKLCTTPTCAAGSVVGSTTTGPAGTYTFAGVPAPPAGQKYYIVEDQATVPATFANGTATVGTLTAAGTGGTTVPGTANTPASKLEGIEFTMPTTAVTGAAPVLGTNYNFGELPVAAISGKVYYDKNGDGILNPSEVGINKTTTMVLCRSQVDPCPAADIAATVTTVNGDYLFTNVPAGTYSIQEVQPAGYGSSTPNKIPNVVMSGASIFGQNFGETLANVSGTVYRDNDASGTLNAGDIGLANVTLRLCTTPACGPTDGPDNGAPLVVTTSPAGTYTFADLPAPPAGKSYYIVEDQTSVTANYPTLTNGTATAGTFAAAPGSTGVTSGVANSPANIIQPINWIPGAAPSLSPAGTGTGYNFGEVPQFSVSGAVFLDKNFDGTVTPGETGLPNNATTTLTLCRTNTSPCPPADTVATTVTTPGSGTYTFPAVTPGSYFVVETQPTGYASSSPNAQPVTVATTPVTGVNFAETGASLSGVVYKDVDYSGTFNSGDVPLSNVTVRLCTTVNCAPGSVVATTASSPGGTYTFADLPSPPAGQSYFIVEDQATVPPSPNPLSDGTTTVGSLTAAGTGGSTAPGTAVQSPSSINGISWTPPSAVVTGVPAVVGTNYNFGEIEGVDIGGKVFFDKNRDGSINAGSDTGIPSVVMTLCRVATVPCPTGQVVATTTTSITGDYTFPRVPPGSYFVQETQPPGYGSSPTSPDVRPITVTSVPLAGINFADTLASIAGLVYRDDNGSQTRDGAEVTMPPGITITLTGIDATGAPVTRTTVTGPNGDYKFDDLKTGTYTITETQPAGFGTGASNVGTGAGGTGAPNNNAITNIVLPTNTDAVNYNFGDVPKTAGVSGTVWVDSNHDNRRDPGEQLLPGWTVQIYKTPIGGGTPTLVTSVTTDAAGAYSVTGLEAGGGYSIRFVAPGGAIFGGAVDGESGTPVSGASITRGEITNLTLTASVTGGPNVIPQQSLPVDPSGVVYDSDTRAPVPGAQVTLVPVNCPTFNPATDLVGGAGNLTQTVGAGGFYQFLLNPSAPACEYRLQVTPPAGYVLDAATPPQPGAFTPPSRPGVAPIVPNPNAPQGTEPTTYYLAFNLNSNSRDVINNHIPLVAAVRPVIFITKVANKTTVEFGDTVRYTVKAKYVSGSVSLPVLSIIDSMPAGFKLIAGTSYVAVPSTAVPVLLPATSISGAPGAVVTYNIPLPAGGLAVGTEVQLTYIVRVAVGSLQGDATNRAQATSVGVLRSNIARATVKVNAGVFTSDGCVAGKVFVDCNNNHIQDAEELGIPGVRLYLSDGTYFVTDSEGKYSYCGLAPKSHVITVDPLTMPRGSRLTTTSNRNLGDGTSLFLDVKNGELMRADFAEGSCSNTVLEQVKARRTQGEVRSVDTEKTGQPAMKWEGKSPQYPQQGTDGANQPLVQPRPATGGVLSTPEQNVPVPQMPGASSNTQGANVRTVK